jgi:hypothetical protein
MEVLQGQPMAEYLKENPISEEEKQKNRMEALKKFLPEKYERVKANLAKAQAEADEE